MKGNSALAKEGMHRPIQEDKVLETVDVVGADAVQQGVSTRGSHKNVEKFPEGFLAGIRVLRDAEGDDMSNF